MRKALFILISFFTFLVMSSTAQESTPYSLKLFIEEYGNFIDGYIEQEQLNLGYINEGGVDYFLNMNDTLLWPDNFELFDNYYKHRLGLQEFYQVFKLYKAFNSDAYYYGFREIGNIELAKSKSKKYYDKHRIFVTEKQVFINNDFFGSDSTAQFASYFDLISWFNPNSETYEWRINKIYEEQAKSWITPQMWTMEARTLFPTLNVDGVDFNIANGIRAGARASWIIGGKNYMNYSFSSGVYFEHFRFTAGKDEIKSLNSTLTDRDNYPFTLSSSLVNFKQSLSFQTITVPVLFKFNSYLKNKKQSLGVYAGANVHLPVNSKVENETGEFTFSGKYKFDFHPDSIQLDKLDSYGFKTYKSNDFQSPDVELKPVFVSLEAGAEFNWYLGKKWLASVSAGYMRSVTAIYSNKNKSLTYNVVENGTLGAFEPQLNSFLTLNDETFLSAASFGIGISYLIDKPVIPHGRVGYRNGAISKMVKSRLVTSGSSFTQKSSSKSVTLFVSDVRSRQRGSRIKYSYIGPSPKFYQGGKINAGAKKGNKLNLQVPASNSGSFLFLEEPYGFELKPQNIEYSNGGMYGEIKKIATADIWEGNNNQRNLDINYLKLADLNLYILSYKYSFDNSGIIRNNIINQLKAAVENDLTNRGISLVYVTSDEPQAWLIKKSGELEQYLPEIELKLTNTDEVSANIEGLKNYLNEGNINPRRSINLNIDISEEFLDHAKEMVENLATVLNIDNDFIETETIVHSYGKMKSLDYDSSLEYLKKVGRLKQQ